MMGRTWQSLAPVRKGREEKITKAPTTVKTLLKSLIYWCQSETFSK